MRLSPSRTRTQPHYRRGDDSARLVEGAAEQHRFGDELDAEAIAHPGSDLVVRALEASRNQGQFKQALLNFDAGVASAGALFAVVLANIAAIFLIRMVGKNLDK